MKSCFLSRRAFVKHSAVLSGALLAGAGRPQPAGAVATHVPNVVRLGYIADLDSLKSPPPVSPTVPEIAAYVGLLGARQGAEEMDYTARLMGQRVELVEAPAPTPQRAVEQAERLAAENIRVLLGGFDSATARALARVAQQRNVLFFNVGATDDRLRNEDCSRWAFHIEASDAMYIDAIADWFIRGLAFLVDENAPQGVQVIQRRPARAWFLVTEDTPLQEARRRRVHAALEQRHWGGRIVADVVLREQEKLGQTVRSIAHARPDLVFLLLSPARQLEFYEQCEHAPLSVEVTGFPDPVTQTRTFFAALLRVAPRTARGSIRMVSWEPTFAAVGGPELTQRFYRRWKQPMDGPAWVSWLAVKILWEALSQTQTTQVSTLRGYLESSEALFEGYQGIGMTFRPWDHQLRHPVMASRLLRSTGDAFAWAEMIGQFPNVLAPGRTPNQVLDQLGDTAETSRCRWR
jgi:ABC-type branched-subunit amino acid transport system substrate-binding protein